MTMDGFTLNILLAAMGVAVVHTILGPDHYLPFLMLARACRWSRSRTMVVTAVCGVGHVASSLLLGGIGLGLGVAVARIEHLEGVRGDWAAWMLIAFGLAYAVWGARKAIRTGKGLEPHVHEDHAHLHSHGADDHAHAGPGKDPQRSVITFWTLFAVFVLGPCEPLIPLFVLPASRGRWDVAAATAVLFGLVTVVTMVAITALGLMGLERIPLQPLERWAHALAGGVIALSGAAIVGLGL